MNGLRAATMWQTERGIWSSHRRSSICNERLWLSHCAFQHTEKLGGEKRKITCLTLSFSLFAKYSVLSQASLPNVILLISTAWWTDGVTLVCSVGPDFLRVEIAGTRAGSTRTTTTTATAAAVKLATRCGDKLSTPLGTWAPPRHTVAEGTTTSRRRILDDTSSSSTQTFLSDPRAAKHDPRLPAPPLLEPGFKSSLFQKLTIWTAHVRTAADILKVHSINIRPI